MGVNPSNGIAAREAERRGRTPFLNLGDNAHETCSIQIAEESKAAGLDKLDYVKTRRAWYYWVVNLTDKALPEKESLALYDKAPDARPFGHCAMTRDDLVDWIHHKREHNRKLREDDWSEKEREEWACVKRHTGKEPYEVPVGVNSWHVDTEEGLKDLVEALKDHFGPFEIKYHKIEKTVTELSDQAREMLDKYVRLTICEDADPEERAQTYLVVGVQGFKIGERRNIEEASWMGEMLAKALCGIK